MLDLYLFLSILRDWWWVSILVLCAILLIVGRLIDKIKSVTSKMVNKYSKTNKNEETNENT